MQGELADKAEAQAEAWQAVRMGLFAHEARMGLCTGLCVEGSPP